MYQGQSKRRGFNYPIPTEVEVPYKSPQPPSNPVVRGLPLHYAASLISSFSIVQDLLWRNGGFAVLRGLEELADVECRYDPAVVPTIGGDDDDDDAPSTKLTDASSLRKPGPSAGERTYYSVLDFHEAYKTGKLTPSAVVEALLPLVRRDVETPTKHSTAFVQTRVDLVRKAAEESTRRYSEGRSLGVLDGVPVGVKDEVDVKGYKTCCGSTVDLKSELDETSWCVSKWEEEGAIVLGKMNMHELGMGTTNNNSNYGTPLNPHNENYYTGGSSGGSAYAVSSGLIPIALGGDGGGSIRIPSSYCGIYGLKPSHGRVSIRPKACATNSTTVYGPLASNMVDLEVAYRVMSRPDPDHPISSLFPTLGPPDQPRPKLLGIYQAWFDRADGAVQSACQTTLDHLVSTHGYTIVPIRIPLIHEGQTAHTLTILSEGVAACPDAAGLTADNKILLSVGAKTPATDFLLAQKLRNLLMQHLAYLFAQHPGLVIVTPTTPNPGCHIAGGKSDLRHGVNDGNMAIRSMEFVWLANFAGLPAISVPVGYVRPVVGDGRIPVGLMGMAEWGMEDQLIELGYECEAWLNGNGKDIKGGRRRPENWVDVLKVAGGTKA
ncbi:MAG: hypothetical protein M1816_007400 [Peltula sp. TS41687]|nr:MAG: hypothetical protein M1816_007400 [Peltula sp. TS41687]